jgi:hypothetical protein
MMRKNLMAACDHVTQSEVVTRHKKKGSMFMFLFSVIALNLVSSLSVLATTTTANAQTPSNSTSNTNSTASNETGVKQMGICVVGAKSPCNGDRNSPT